MPTSVPVSVRAVSLVSASRAEEENAITGDEDVGGLDVTVDDALTVRRGERVEHSLPQPEHGSGAERAIRELLERRPSTYSMA